MAHNLRGTIFTPHKLRQPEDQTRILKECISKAIDREGFEVRYVNKLIGKGLFATKKFYAGDFLVEYHGELISVEEGRNREKNYPLSLGSYIFDFNHKGKTVCIDATFSTLFGRYINDGIESEKNAEVRCQNYFGRPYLLIFATKNIRPNEEIRFDYGVKDLPWRKSKHVSVTYKTQQLLSEETQNSKNPTHNANECNQQNTQIITRECHVRLNRIDLARYSGYCKETTQKRKQTDNTISQNNKKKRLDKEVAPKPQNNKKKKLDKDVAPKPQRDLYRNADSRNSTDTETMHVNDTCGTSSSLNVINLSTNHKNQENFEIHKHTSAEVEFCELEMTYTVSNEIRIDPQPTYYAVNSQEDNDFSLDKYTGLPCEGTTKRKPDKTEKDKTVLCDNEKNCANVTQSQDEMHSVTLSEHVGHELPTNIGTRATSPLDLARYSGYCKETTQKRKQTDNMISQNNKKKRLDKDVVPKPKRDLYRNVDSRNSTDTETMHVNDTCGTSSSLNVINLSTNHKNQENFEIHKHTSAEVECCDLEMTYTVSNEIRIDPQPTYYAVNSQDDDDFSLDKNTGLPCEGTTIRKSDKTEKDKIVLCDNEKNCANVTESQDEMHSAKLSEHVGHELPTNIGTRATSPLDLARYSGYCKETTQKRKQTDNMISQNNKKNRLDKDVAPKPKRDLYRNVDSRNSTDTETMHVNDTCGTSSSLNVINLSTNHKNQENFEIHKHTSAEVEFCDLEMTYTVSNEIRIDPQPTYYAVSSREDNDFSLDKNTGFPCEGTTKRKSDKIEKDKAVLCDNEKNCANVTQSQDEMHSATLSEHVGHELPTNMGMRVTSPLDCSKERDSNKSPRCGSKTKKPYRPCPFCGKFQSKLRTHYISKHKTETEVKHALSLPKKERDAAFNLLKRKGIMKKNLEVMGKPNTNLILERSRRSKDIVYCSKCFAFISKKFFHRHKKNCYMKYNSTEIPLSMSSTISCNPDFANEFERYILNSFRQDEVGMICRTDTLIVSYGKQEYSRVKIHSDKKDEKKKTLKNEMRRLGCLYKEFKEACVDEGITNSTSYDMFKRENFKILEGCINQICMKSDGSFKDGYKLSIGYLIKKVGKHIQGDFLINKEDEKAAEINNFLTVVSFHWLNTFGDSEYLVKKRRQTNLRKPCNLPFDEDIKKLKTYIIKEIKQIVKDVYTFMTQSEYVLLRDLLICRLTLFNARRGGEASRLTISEWLDADKNSWFDKQTLNTGDPMDKMLMGKYKLAYQPGKTGKLVPLLVKDDCWDAMKLMTDPEIRKQVGVPETNLFVFPNTQMSESHVCGWKAVQKCCQLADCSSTVTATRRRHQVSTLYAAEDVSETDRKAFLQHMDHAEGINLNVYQSPPAFQETTRVGRFLHSLDSDDSSTEDDPQPSTSQTAVECPDEMRKSMPSRGLKQYKLTKKLKSKTISNSPYRSNSDSDVDYINFSEESSDEEDAPRKPHSHKSSPKKPRAYTRWEVSQTKIIREYFQKYIYATENLENNRGHLPVLGEIEKFLQKNITILAGFKHDDRVKMVKLKIFNERKLVREKLRKNVKNTL